VIRLSGCRDFASVKAQSDVNYIHRAFNGDGFSFLYIKNVVVAQYGQLWQRFELSDSFLVVILGCHH